MKSKIIIAALLALSISLSSCGFIVFPENETETKAQETLKPEDNDENVTEEPTETVATLPQDSQPEDKISDRAKERVEALSDFNFKDQSFIIATTSEMTFAADGDSYYDRVLLLRDSIVEDKFNVDIITVATDYVKLETELKTAALAEEYYADLISVPGYKIGTLAVNGLIKNLRSLPFYTPSSSYSRNSGAGIAGNAIFADIGAASCDFSKLYAVFFNRNAAESLGFDLDIMVEDGEWTWDTFDRIARLANEKFGMIGHGTFAMGDEYTDIILRSANMKLVDNPLGETPVISFDSQKLESLVELTCSLIYGNPSAYKPNENSSNSDFYSLFISGQLLFALAPLRYMDEFSKCAIEWGVLPIPKADESQKEYYSYTEGTANVLAVPSENNKSEMTGVLINALNTASYELLTEEYKTNCLYNYFGNIKPMKSMDKLLGSMTFCFSYLYSSGADHLADATYGAVRQARTSTADYATDLINARKDTANRQLEKLFGNIIFEEEELPIPQPPSDVDNADSEAEETTEVYTEKTEITDNTEETETEPETNN